MRYEQNILSDRFEMSNFSSCPTFINGPANLPKKARRNPTD